MKYKVGDKVTVKKTNEKATIIEVDDILQIYKVRLESQNEFSFTIIDRWAIN